MQTINNKSIFHYIDPRNYKIIGMDTECHLITEDEPIPDLVCITFSEQPYIYGGTQESKLEGARQLLKYLADPNVIIVGHYIFFDLSVIIKFFSKINPEYELTLNKYFWAKIRDGKIRDTGVTSKLIAISKDWLRFDPKHGGPAEFSLEDLVKRHLDIEMTGKHGEDVWRLNYSKLDGLNVNLFPKEAVDYAVDDAILAKKLYEHLINKYPTSPDEIFQVESAYVLHKMGVWGIFTDSERANILDQKISPIIKECQKELIKEGYLRPPNFSVNRKLLKEEIIKELGDKTPKTPKGDVSLTAKVFNACNNTIVTTYLKYKSVINDVRCLWEKIDSLSVKDMDLKRKYIEEYTNMQHLLDIPISINLIIEEEPTQNKEQIRETILEFFKIDKGNGEFDYTKVPLTDAVSSMKKEELELLYKNVDSLRKVISTDRETILQVPSLEKLAQMSEFYKIKTTYIPIFKKGSILHPNWNPLVATGRVSVSNPNLNNMPREHGVRECFKARPGYVFVTADYSQAELCSLSQICMDLFGYSKMGEAIKDNKDLHLLLASQILGITYEEALSKYTIAKARDKKTATDQELQEDKVILDARQMAKAANFGYPGGLGIDTFISYAWTSYKVRITRKAAAELKQIWLETYPEINEFFAYVSKKLHRKNYSDNDSSRFDLIQHRSGRIRGKVGYCDGLNSYFQGLTADGAKYSKNLISYEMYCNPESPLYGSRIVAFIYDEILMECPEEKAHEAAMELSRLLLIGMRVFLPDIPSKIEVEMMRRWIKAAKAVYVNGKLVPFDA